MRRILIIVPLVLCGFLPAQQGESWLGNLAPIARSIQRERGFPMEFAGKGSLGVEEWRKRGRAEVAERLAVLPETGSARCAGSTRS